MGRKREPVSDPADDDDLPWVRCAGVVIPPARRSCPTSHERSLPFPVVPPQAGTGRLARPGSPGLAGQRDAGMQPSPACSQLRGRRGAGGGRAAPVAWQLPCKSPSCQKTFFPAIQMGFAGTGSGLADQVVLRNHTLYLEGPCIRFGQVWDMQPAMRCETRLLMGTAQQGGLQGRLTRLPRAPTSPFLPLLRDHDALHHLHPSKRQGMQRSPPLPSSGNP